MEEDILNYLYQLSCFVGHPVIFSQIQKLFWKIQHFIFGFTSPYFKKYFYYWKDEDFEVARTRNCCGWPSFPLTPGRTQ